MSQLGGSADAWIRTHVQPTGAYEVEKDRAWAQTVRVPTTGGAVWFKACGASHRFEPPLTAALSVRWPDRVVHVLAHDDDRAWLLLADAGTPIGAGGNPAEPWLELLPRYAELQRGEAARVRDHLARGVPDFRAVALPARYAEFLGADLPLDPREIERFRAFAPGFAELCGELASFGIPDTVQHDDLHSGNVYDDGGTLRVLDWGDTWIGHPFASLVATFLFLERRGRLAPGDPWFARLRDAYLEPWGGGLDTAFDLAFRVGSIAHMVAWAPILADLRDDERASFRSHYAELLRLVLTLL